MLSDLSRQRITDLDVTTKQGKKLAQKIRDARKARSAASQQGLKFMLEIPELGTPLKSGNREFSSPLAKAGLEAARMKAFKAAGYGLSGKEKIARATKPMLPYATGALVLGGLGLGGYALLQKNAIKVGLVNQGVNPKALEGMELPDKPVDRNGNLTQECATYINTWLRNNGIDAGGDAYQMGRRYSDVINGFDHTNITPDMTGYSGTDSVNAIKQMDKEASEYVKKNFNPNTLRKDHVYPVNMYYKTSKHIKDFYKKSIDENTKTPGTHIGLMYWDGKDWKVAHNIHGTVHKDKATDIMGWNDVFGNTKYGITAIRDAGVPKQYQL